MIVKFSQLLHDNLEINLAIMENILYFKNLEQDLLRFLVIKSNHQLYPLTNKSQEMSNSKNQIINCII